MQREMKKKFKKFLISSGALVFGIMPMTNVLASTSQNVVATTFSLIGNTPKAVQDGKVTASQTLSTSKTITVLFALSSQNEQVIQQAANTHTKLSAQTYEQAVSPGQTAMDAVTNFANQYNLQVGQPINFGQLIPVTGTVGQIQSALNIQFKTFNVNGKSYYSNVSDPQLPSNLSGIVKSVVGLNNFPVKSFLKTKANTNVSQTANSTTYTPEDILNAYQLGSFQNKTNNGAGQDIDIIIWNAPDTNNLDTFITDFGQSMQVNGNSALTSLPAFTDSNYTLIPAPLNGTPTIDESAGSQEAELDVEWSHVVAPQAHTYVFDGVDGSNASLFQAIAEAIQYKAAGQNNAHVMSMSWGLEEDYIDANTQAMYHDLFQEALANGITPFAASGDYGAYTDSQSTSPVVSSPTDDPIVVSVGGTSLYYDSASGTRTEEDAWDYSGGGYSQIFSKPDYQLGVVPDNYQTRGVPDVSLDADINYAFVENQTPSVVGGTSVACPIWAAMGALMNNQLNSQNLNTGLLQDALYGVYKEQLKGSVTDDVYDVTSGANTDGGTGSGYAAGIGWDPVTGIGTPGNGSNFLSDLVAYIQSHSSVSNGSIIIDPSTSSFIESTSGSKATDKVVQIITNGISNLSTSNISVTLQQIVNTNAYTPGSSTGQVVDIPVSQVSVNNNIIQFNWQDASWDNQSYHPGVYKIKATVNGTDYVTTNELNVLSGNAAVWPIGFSQTVDLNNDYGFNVSFVPSAAITDLTDPFAVYVTFPEGVTFPSALDPIMFTVTHEYWDSNGQGVAEQLPVNVSVYPYESNTLEFDISLSSGHFAGSTIDPSTLRPNDSFEIGISPAEGISFNQQFLTNGNVPYLYLNTSINSLPGIAYPFATNLGLSTDTASVSAWDTLPIDVYAYSDGILPSPSIDDEIAVSASSSSNTMTNDVYLTPFNGGMATSIFQFDKFGNYTISAVDQSKPSGQDNFNQNNEVTVGSDNYTPAPASATITVQKDLAVISGASTATAGDTKSYSISIKSNDGTHVITGYQGSLNITTRDQNGNVINNIAPTITNGTSSFNVSFTNQGTYTITASDADQGVLGTFTTSVAALNTGGSSIPPVSIGGGTSGTSDSGSSTAIDVTKSTSTVVESDQKSTNIQPTTMIDGDTVTATITDNDLNKVLQQSTDATESTAIVIPVNTDKNQQAEVTLTPSQVNIITTSNLKNTIVVSNGESSVAVPASILQYVPKGASVQIVITPAPTSTSNFENAIAGTSVIGTPVSFDVNVVNGSQVQAIDVSNTEFIKRSFTISGNTDLNSAGVLFIEDGKVHAVPATFTNNSDGTITVTVNRPGFSTYAVVSHQVIFSDISNSWAKDKVQVLANKYLLYGKDANRFDPTGKVTRAEFAAMLVRALGLNANGTTPFIDVKDTDWFASDVAAAYQAKLISGVDSQTFNPNGFITREDMAVMLSKAMKALQVKVTPTHRTFNDIQSVSSYAQSGVQDVVTSGIMSGVSNGTMAMFNPKGITTRDQAASVMYQLLTLAKLIN